MGSLKTPLKNHNIKEMELKITLKWNLKAYERQFGWGDSLLKCNKGLQRYAKKCNSRSMLDCECHNTNRDESRL